MCVFVHYSLLRVCVGSPLADTIEEGSSLASEGHDLASPARALESSCLAPQQESVQLPMSVANTILEVRAPSTRCLYALKWSVFSDCCAARNEDPSSCVMSYVLTFPPEQWPPPGLGPVGLLLVISVWRTPGHLCLPSPGFLIWTSLPCRHGFYPLKFT